MKASEHAHLERIRDRFSTTAEPFAEFALSLRAKEGEWMAAVATSDFADAERALGIDLACGPGTLTRPFLAHLARVIGIDLTPAMLVQARQTTRDSGPDRVGFVCANAYALPFADGAADIAFCGYAMHHLLEPGAAIREMARVVRNGGRVAVIDLVLPEGADREMHDRIERTRDSSHASTLRTTELRSQFRDAGLHVRTCEHNNRDRDFDHWMHVAGHEPGSETYIETRRLMEATIANDAAGFRPRPAPGNRALQLGQTAVLLVAEKTGGDSPWSPRQK
jgi:ubiquinone/menaquinone biosynthesis C-methylase UbiE